MKEKVIVIVGPTGIGKTELALKLCEKYKKDIQENLNLKPNQTFLVSKYKKQAGYFKEDELYNILKQFINLDEKYKDGDIDLNIGIEAVICGYCS